MGEAIELEGLDGDGDGWRPWCRRHNAVANKGAANKFVGSELVQMLVVSV
jgi:hypothetical protein